MKHTSHDDVVKRLKRSSGHLRKTIEMIEAGRECTDIAQQLHAVEKAVRAAKTKLIQDHIDHCLIDASGNAEAGQDLLKEFKEIARYL